MPHDSERHAQHDPLLVVSLAAGDITADERNRAASLIADCAACARLHDDLLAIARATATLPAALRPRDFQLTPEQAARLRPGGWRRFVAAFASPRLAMTRQLGVGLTTLGLAGLLVSVLPTVQLGGMGGAAAMPAPEQVFSGTDDSSGSGVELAPGAAAASAAPSAAPISVVGGEASASQDRAVHPDTTSAKPSSARSAAGVNQGAQPTATDVAILAPAERLASDGTTTDGTGASLIVVASAILLAAGLALLVARRIARSMTGS